MTHVNRILLLGIIGIIFIINPITTVMADSYYPLQTKYPDTIKYKAETGEKIIALTFDDGPDNVHTPAVLDVLKKHHVRATFFLLGARVEKYPEMVKRIDEEQHEIGNHTYWHPKLTETGEGNMVFEINKNEEAINRIIQKETTLFRAPYGALNETLVSKLPDLGYRAVGWSIDSEDWKGLSKEEIKKRVIDRLHPGAIILMHSAGNVNGTVEALDELIPYMEKIGYHFVTVPEMWQEIYK